MPATPPSVPGAQTGGTHSLRAGAPDPQPHFRPSLPTLAPDARPLYLAHGLVDRARRVPSPLASVPRSRPSLPMPAHHTRRTDWRIVHATRRHLLLPSTIAMLPSKTSVHRPVARVHTASPPKPTYHA
ncbi:hypothetical protein K488DRAFT_92837 [Vararia minispora EC-137]|uniref:Uncharacterized protein n=1 Tax=Vararia minispora EC-137 TaxID=1314806 RepID=A0ACB8Q3X9_9AGAM|nr:hypothetical protein K488DRAFT_92837 [Vararia minispora EC-137]